MLQAAGVLLIIGIWVLIALYQRRIAATPFPYPWEAVRAIFTTRGTAAGSFTHLGASLLRWLTGYLLAVGTGVLIGIFMALVPVAGTLLYPLVHVIQLIPGLAWVPIALILFGLGNGATIFMIAATAVVPVIINTRSGIQQINQNMLRAARMMELGHLSTFTKIILPGAAPSIVSGLRIASANGFRVLISAEMVVGSGLGLGYSLLQARWNLDYSAAFGALVLIVLTGLIFEQALFYPLEMHVRRRRGLA